jgi:hypothetical protein
MVLFNFQFNKLRLLRYVISLIFPMAEHLYVRRFVSSFRFNVAIDETAMFEATMRPGFKSM